MHEKTTSGKHLLCCLFYCTTQGLSRQHHILNNVRNLLSAFKGIVVFFPPLNVSKNIWKRILVHLGFPSLIYQMLHKYPMVLLTDWLILDFHGLSSLSYLPWQVPDPQSQEVGDRGSAPACSEWGGERWRSSESGFCSQVLLIPCPLLLAQRTPLWDH